MQGLTALKLGALALIAILAFALHARKLVELRALRRPASRLGSVTGRVGSRRSWERSSRSGVGGRSASSRARRAIRRGTLPRALALGVAIVTVIYI